MASRKVLRLARAVPIVLLASLSIALASSAQAATGGRGPLRLLRVATGLQHPVFVTPAPSRLPDRLYVVERAGVIRIVDRGRALSKPFLDLRRQVQDGGLRGMFSLAFDPDYLRNGKFFVNYVGRDGDIYVTEFRSVQGVGALSSRRVLLHVSTPRKAAFGHYGGQLAFGPDRRLYASFGDGGQPETAQDPTTLLGKLVRLDVDTPRAKPEVLALGLRNPWRFSFDRVTGDVYIGDVGEDLREEIDRLPRGFQGVANFGWNVWEGSVRIRPTPSDLQGRVLLPFLEYRHAPGRCNAVTGGYVYRGSELERLRGRYIYGDLCGGVWSVTVRGGVARDKRAEPLSPPGLLVSFAEGWRDELYVVVLNGVIYEISTVS
jgi:glucose/arabinose dehydrogenase